jgi:hypothetical protein
MEYYWQEEAEKIQSKIEEFKRDNQVPLKTVHNLKYGLNEIPPLISFLAYSITTTAQLTLAWQFKRYGENETWPH